MNVPLFDISGARSANAGEWLFRLETVVFVELLQLAKIILSNILQVKMLLAFCVFSFIIVLFTCMPADIVLCIIPTYAVKC